MSRRHVAVIDIGKTNAKVALVDLERLEERDVIKRRNDVLPGPPYPHFDVERQWRFILDGLAALHREHGVDAITTTTHGASMALLGNDGGLATPVLDYEHDGPDELTDAYDAIRPGFSETGSPRLPMGLNLGAQLFWLLETQPGLRERVSTIVTYPQYWAYRLTGIPSVEPTLLGAHSDLWNPHARRFSSLAGRLGIEERFAPVRDSRDILGTILPEVSRATGLPADTPVACGIHDSNASLYPHLMAREGHRTVVSTGTWVIAMALHGAMPALDPSRDTLINVSALGDPVPSARFMGGREFEMILAGRGREPDAADTLGVLDGGIMLLPQVEPSAGPFMGKRARWRGEEPAVGSGGRAAAASLYLGMVTAGCLDLIGHRGEIVLEGGFTRNRLFLEMLGAATGASILCADAATGTSIGAALLHAQRVRPPPLTRFQPSLDGDRLRAYRGDWRDAVDRAPSSKENPVC
jgi:sugar (pentulose or hexulose) kinase